MFSCFCPFLGMDHSALNKPRWPTESVGYFAQRSRLLFSPFKKDSLKPLDDTVSYSTQTICLLQILLKPLRPLSSYLHWPLQCLTRQDLL